jgi:hypothetical protein
VPFAKTRISIANFDLRSLFLTILNKWNSVNLSLPIFKVIHIWVENDVSETTIYNNRGH